MRNQLDKTSDKIDFLEALALVLDEDDETQSPEVTQVRSFSADVGESIMQMNVNNEQRRDRAVSDHEI